MSLEGDCREVEATPNLELLVTFGMSLEEVCHEFYTEFHIKLNLICFDQKFLDKSSILIRYLKFTVWSVVGP
jgi:hypothetical protein